jgi:hypothetical protein
VGLHKDQQTTKQNVDPLYTDMTRITQGEYVGGEVRIAGWLPASVNRVCGWPLSHRGYDLTVYSARVVNPDCRIHAVVLIRMPRLSSDINARGRRPPPGLGLAT